LSAFVRDTGKLSDAVAQQIFAPYLEIGKNVLPRKGEDQAQWYLQPRAGTHGRSRRHSKPVPPAERFIDLQIPEGGWD